MTAVHNPGSRISLPHEHGKIYRFNFIGRTDSQTFTETAHRRGKPEYLVDAMPPMKTHEACEASRSIAISHSVSRRKDHISAMTAPGQATQVPLHRCDAAHCAHAALVLMWCLLIQFE